MKRFALICIFCLFLWATWLFTPTRVLWDGMDALCFKLLNGSLNGHPRWQYFWAFANGHYMDWIHDIVFLFFFAIYIAKGKKGFKSQRVIETLLFIPLTAFTIILVNKLFCSHLLGLTRASPTLVMDNVFLLSEHINLPHVKDISRCSFPGDHATTASLFVGYLFLLGGWRFGLPALAYGIFFCLPRLISGAHWLTDNLMGSAPIALIILSLTFDSSLFRVIKDILIRLILREKIKQSL